MIRFKQFLLREDEDSTVTFDAAEVAARINKECSKFLNMKSGFLFRGISEHDDMMVDLDKDSLFLKGKIRTDREPRDSNAALHEILNNYFKQKFGEPLRSTSLFVIGDADSASNYAGFNETYAIFPIGDFSYVWSPLLTDATNAFQMHWDNDGTEESADYMRAVNKAWKKYAKGTELEQFTLPMDYAKYVAANNNHHTIFQDDNWAEFIKYFIEDSDLWIKNKRLDDTTSSIYHEHEVMIQGKEYYAVNTTVLAQIVPLLSQ